MIAVLEEERADAPPPKDERNGDRRWDDIFCDVCGDVVLEEREIWLTYDFLDAAKVVCSFKCARQAVNELYQGWREKMDLDKPEAKATNS